MKSLFCFLLLGSFLTISSMDTNAGARSLERFQHIVDEILYVSPSTPVRDDVIQRVPTSQDSKDSVGLDLDALVLSSSYDHEQERRSAMLGNPVANLMENDILWHGCRLFEEESIQSIAGKRKRDIDQITNQEAQTSFHEQLRNRFFKFKKKK